MSLQQLYETVIREEEYIMDKKRDFRAELRSEFMASDSKYCCYCLTPQGGKSSCCEENHFVPFRDLYEEDQEYMLDDEVEQYEQWSKK